MIRLIELVLFKPSLQSDGVEDVTAISLGSFYATIYQSEGHYRNINDTVGINTRTSNITYIIRIGNQAIVDSLYDYINGISGVVMCIKKNSRFFKINTIDATHYPTIKLFISNEMYQQTI